MSPLRARVAAKSRSSTPAASSRAKKHPFPGFVQPCHPTLRDAPPLGDEWLYEIKSDGYRAQVHVDAGRVTIYSREGLDWTAQYPTIADAARKLRAQSAILDGEAVVLGKSGAADLQALRRELGDKRSQRMLFYAFDLLYLDGRDLRGTELIERKRLLQKLLANAPAPIVYVDHLEGEGSVIFHHACKIGVEGVVGKLRNSPYKSGRQESWFKLKCAKSDTFPIVAFVEKLGAKPRRIASLYIGRREGDRLLYAGKVRSGYTDETLRELRERLDPYIQKTSPLSEPIAKPKATWVRPVVQAEIKYSSVTDGGLLREAVYKGLRDDLDPAPPRRPRIAARMSESVRVGVPRENILQLLPDAVVPSKGELAEYWSRVWKRALVHLGNRPLKLVRHTHSTTFYHKGPLPPVPASVNKLKLEKREGGEGTRLWVDSLDGLLGLVEIGAVELHPWNATVDDIERADRLVFDLDPGEGVTWDFVVESALALRKTLAAQGLESWPKSTGGKGLHLMVPLDRRINHDSARGFCRRIAQDFALRDRERYVLVADPAKRHGRIFIDYLRNGRGTTAIGTYSPRALAGFPVAAPLSWKQVESGVKPLLTMAKPPRR